MNQQPLLNHTVALCDEDGRRCDLAKNATGLLFRADCPDLGGGKVFAVLQMSPEWTPSTSDGKVMMAVEIMNALMSLQSYADEELERRSVLHSANQKG